MNNKKVHIFRNLDTGKEVRLRDNTPAFTEFVREKNMYLWWYVGTE